MRPVQSFPSLMRHHPRASPARSSLPWAVVLLCLPCAPGAASEPPANAAHPQTVADSTDPATWPRFALREAGRAAAAVEHPHRRVQVLEQIATVSTGLGDCGSARIALADAVDETQGIADRSLRDLALRDIALKQVECRDAASALATLDGIESPDERDAVWSAVVSAQVGSVDLSAALASAQRIGDSIALSDALRTIAIAHAAVGHLSEARQVADRIPEFLVRAMAIADIAARHADIGNAQALNTARLIARNTPNARQRDVALSYVAGIQAQSGDVRGALSTSTLIKDDTSKAYALTRIANARLRTSDISAVPELLNRALNTARRSKPSGATAAVLCEIAQTFTLSGDRAQARAALDHALIAATASRRLRQQTAIIEKIARTRAGTGDIAGALTIADRVPDGSSRALLVHDILAAQAETGDIDGALKTSGTLSDFRLQVAGLFGIIGVQMTSGDVAGARASLQQILELTGEARDAGFRSHSLGAVAAAQVELGDHAAAWPSFEAALAEAAALPDAYARALAYVDLSDPFTRRP